MSDIGCTGKDKLTVALLALLFRLCVLVHYPWTIQCIILQKIEMTRKYTCNGKSLIWYCALVVSGGQFPMMLKFQIKCESKDKLEFAFYNMKNLIIFDFLFCAAHFLIFGN